MEEVLQELRDKTFIIAYDIAMTMSGWIPGWNDDEDYDELNVVDFTTSRITNDGDLWYMTSDYT